MEAAYRLVELGARDHPGNTTGGRGRPSGMDSGRGQRCRSLPQILKRGVDPGADDTDGSKLVCQLQSPAKAGSQSFGRALPRAGSRARSRASPDGRPHEAAFRQRQAHRGDREERDHPASVGLLSRSSSRSTMFPSLETPTTVPGIRGASRRTTVPSAEGSAPGRGEAVARA